METTQNIGSVSRPHNPTPDSTVSRTMALFDKEIKHYGQKMSKHPIAKLCVEQKLSIELLHDYAKLQFVDSILWVPMLALIKGAVKSPRLVKAVTANMLCEAGADGMPHVTMCKNFVESLGITPRYGDYSTFAPLSAHPVEVMMAIQDHNEAFIAGWLYAAETLVPMMFQVFRDAYKNIPGVDMQYFNEHIAIDADEHSQWMRESVEELLTQSDCSESVMAGIDIGARVALCIPDVLYSRAIREQQTIRN